MSGEQMTERDREWLTKSQQLLINVRGWLSHSGSEISIKAIDNYWRKWREVCDVKTLSDEEITRDDLDLCAHGWSRQHPQPCPECENTQVTPQTTKSAVTPIDAVDLVERHLGVFLKWAVGLGPNSATSDNARRAAEEMVRVAYAEGKMVGFQDGEYAGRKF